MMIFDSAAALVPTLSPSEWEEMLVGMAGLEMPDAHEPYDPEEWDEIYAEMRAEEVAWREDMIHLTQLWNER